MEREGREGGHNVTKTTPPVIRWLVTGLLKSGPQDSVQTFIKRHSKEDRTVSDVKNQMANVDRDHTRYRASSFVYALVTNATVFAYLSIHQFISTHLLSHFRPR